VTHVCKFCGFEWNWNHPCDTGTYDYDTGEIRYEYHGYGEIQECPACASCQLQDATPEKCEAALLTRKVREKHHPELFKPRVKPRVNQA
jgi:hypothetical protein